jgi:hypothetical protein
MNVRPDLAAEAFRRGASAYVVKHCAAEDLIVAVRRVVKGRSYLSPQISKETVDCLRWTGAKFSKEKRLTDRQREVLQLLSGGENDERDRSCASPELRHSRFPQARIKETLNIRTSAELIQDAATELTRKSIAGNILRRSSPLCCPVLFSDQFHIVPIVRHVLPAIQTDDVGARLTWNASAVTNWLESSRETVVGVDTTKQSVHYFGEDLPLGCVGAVGMNTASFNATAMAVMRSGIMRDLKT